MAGFPRGTFTVRWCAMCRPAVLAPAPAWSLFAQRGVRHGRSTV
ncbi:hypothetical protein ACFPIJ_64070 [Dactylosporangium cerinum]|uniref:Uncharacterized protein n=1 Tax=Dactylosporangium cerinum TaxID=1434730 RepID=A0ABV9WJL2_9ACTN